jgi:hypothetical protein
MSVSFYNNWNSLELQPSSLLSSVWRTNNHAHLYGTTITSGKQFLYTVHLAATMCGFPVLVNPFKAEKLHINNQTTTEVLGNAQHLFFS